MSLLDIFKPKDKKDKRPWRFLSGGTNRVSTFGDDIYKLDAARQATNRIITEMSKLDPRHRRTDSAGHYSQINSDIAQVLKAPNWQMTTADFLKKQIAGLLYYQNYFIFPEWRENPNGTRSLVGLWPITAQTVEINEYSDGRMYCEFHYQAGYDVTIAYEEMIHLRLDFSSHELMGGDKYGRPDNDAILETCKINSSVLKSVAKSAANAASYKGLITTSVYLSEEEQAEQKKNFLARLNAGEDSWLFMDGKAELAQINNDPKWIDADTLKFLDNKILRNWGVSSAVLNGDFTPQQHAAFFQIAIEPIVVTLNQAYTKALFTLGERQHGNEIIFYSNRMEDWSLENKIQVVEKVGGRGALTNDQILEMFGFPPIGGDLGNMRMQSLNYIDQELAKQYQINTSLTKGMIAPNNASDQGGQPDAKESSNGAI